MREKNEKKIISDVRGNKWNEKNFQKNSNSKIKILIREHDLCIDYKFQRLSFRCSTNKKGKRLED